jgi:hypothetical protein
MDSGLAVAIVLGIVIGWPCVILILLSLLVLKGDFKSSYNYRPWKPFVVPEDLADKANREGAKWLLVLALLTIVGLISGAVYGWVTGDYYFMPFTVLPVMLVLLIALTIGIYLYSWLLLQRRNAGKI